MPLHLYLDSTYTCASILWLAVAQQLTEALAHVANVEPSKWAPMLVCLLTSCRCIWCICFSRTITNTIPLNNFPYTGHMVGSKYEVPCSHWPMSPRFQSAMSWHMSEGEKTSTQKNRDLSRFHTKWKNSTGSQSESSKWKKILLHFHQKD